MTSRFRAIREESNLSFVKHQYKIVFEHNRSYTLGRMRFEPAGWTIRCSDCDEDLQRRVSAKLASEGRKFPLKRALELFREAYDELDNEAMIEQVIIEAWAA